jgi:hypothetical protein
MLIHEFHGFEQCVERCMDAIARVIEIVGRHRSNVFVPTSNDRTVLVLFRLHALTRRCVRLIF